VINTQIENVLDATNGHLVILSKSSSGVDLTSYSLANIYALVGINNSLAGYAGNYPDIFTSSLSKFSLIVGASRLYALAYNPASGAAYLRHINISLPGGALIANENATGLITLTGATISGNAQMKLSFYNDTGGDGNESPLIMLNNNAGLINLYKPTYPLAATTSLIANRKAVSAAVAANSSGNPALVSITLPNNAMILGDNGTGAATASTRVVWIAYVNGINLYHSLVNLDTFDDGTTSASDNSATGVGISAW
jgi:hypothetical protein